MRPKPLSERTRYTIVGIASVLLLATTVAQGIRNGFGIANWVSITAAVVMFVVSAWILTRSRN